MAIWVGEEWVGGWVQAKAPELSKQAGKGAADPGHTGPMGHQNTCPLCQPP